MRAILIGSPGSGKTTLLKKIQKRDIDVFHADSYINKIYKKGEIGYEIILNVFGPQFVNKSQVDKKMLGDYLSKNMDKLSILNDNIFPVIKEHLSGKDNYVAELPIITNSNVKFDYDIIILVTASKKVIIERLTKNKKINRGVIREILERWNDNSGFNLKFDTTNGINDSDVDDLIESLGLKASTKN